MGSSNLCRRARMKREDHVRYARVRMLGGFDEDVAILALRRECTSHGRSYWGVSS